MIPTAIRVGTTTSPWPATADRHAESSADQRSDTDPVDADPVEAETVDSVIDR
jgi:hypothetical protein